MERESDREREREKEGGRPRDRDSALVELPRAQSKKWDANVLPQDCTSMQDDQRKPGKMHVHIFFSSLTTADMMTHLPK
jgi:hypothetical protein